MAIDWKMEQSGLVKASAEGNRCLGMAEDYRRQAADFPPGQEKEDRLGQAKIWDNLSAKNFAKAEDHQKQIDAARKEMLQELRERDQGHGKDGPDDPGYSR